jgi:hypothetical protein
VITAQVEVITTSEDPPSAGQHASENNLDAINVWN